MRLGSLAAAQQERPPLSPLLQDDCELTEIPPAVWACTALTRLELSRNSRLSVTHAGLAALRALLPPGGALLRVHLRGCEWEAEPWAQHPVGYLAARAALPGVQVLADDSDWPSDGFTDEED